MKRIISIIVVTTIIFLIGFVFLRVENEDFAATLLDDTGLNSVRIRKHKDAMSWSVSTGSTLSGEVMTGNVLTWSVLTGTTTTWSTSTGTEILSGTLQIEVN